MAMEGSPDPIRKPPVPRFAESEEMIDAQGDCHRSRVHANLRVSPDSGYIYKLIFLFILIKNSFRA